MALRSWGVRAAARAKISRRRLGWALEAVVIDHLSVTRTAARRGESWHNTRFVDKNVTVIIDLTLTRDQTGPARSLDMVQGCSKAVVKKWPASRLKVWRDGIEVVAMDAPSGFTAATAEELPDAVPVIDPFHVVRLAGAGLDRCRQRTARAPPRVSTRFPQPHQLHRQITPRKRMIQTPPTLRTAMSP